MCRKLIYLISFVLLLGLCSNASADLVVHWKLDEGQGTTAFDSSGNGHNGTFSGAPAWVSGKIDGALEFHSGGDCVGHTFGEKTWQACTVALWVKMTTLGQAGYRSVFSNYTPNTAGFQIDVDGGNPGNYRIHPSALLFGTVKTDWVYLTMASVGTSVKLYYDGSFVTSGNLTDMLFNEFVLGTSRSKGSYAACTIDDFRVYDNALSEAEIQNVMKGVIILPTVASGPGPADEATDVLQDVVLSWKPADFANTHDVYFGNNFSDINDASRTNPLNVLISQGQDANTCDPAGLFELGQTYYWRVDEVNAPPDYTIFKGNVWSFTVEPFAYPIAGTFITATASSSNSADEGSENTINNSGIDNKDLHSNDSKAMWLSSIIGQQPTWIQYEFDQVYKLHQMLVWNYNSSLEPVIGLGIKQAIIEYSTDGADWSTLGTTHEFARAPGAAGYASNTTVDLSGIVAKYVKITANSNWGSIFNQYGLSEVRFFYIPVLARGLNPASGTTDMDVDNVTLSWRAGREAVKHNVYLSTDQQAVIDETISPVSIPADSSYASYDTGALELDKSYYWKVNEVNEAKTPSIWQGDVLSFTTQKYLAVDDFEDYNDFEPDRIFDTWIDGWNVPENGSQVGSDLPPFAEQSIVHGGSQAMALHYDNTTASYSEAAANVANLPISQDWTKHGIKTLSLYFYGDTNNSVTEKMYVKLNGSKVTYDGDADNITRIGWQPWNIELASLGLNLRNVTELSIGFERSGAVGGKGKVYFDDISLYPYSRQLVTPTEPSQAGLVGHWQFEGNLNDISGNGRHGTAVGDPAFVAGKIGQAISLDGIGDYVEITGYKGILGGGAFSIAVWVKSTSTGDVTMVSWGAPTNGQRVDFRLYQGRLRIEHGNGNLQGNTVLADGQWHHVALTVSENAPLSYPAVKLYLDGYDDSQTTTDPDTFNIMANVDVNIGRRGTNNDRVFSGSLDDVRIYERALSQEEIAWLAGRTKPFDKPF